MGAIAAAEPASAAADFAAEPAAADRLAAGAADSAAAFPTAALGAVAKIGRRFNRSREPADRAPENPDRENQIQIPASPDLASQEPAIPGAVNPVLANPVLKNQGQANPVPVLLAGADRNPGSPDPENQTTAIGPVARIDRADPAMAIAPVNDRVIVPVINRVIVLAIDRALVRVTDRAIGLITVIDRAPASRATRTGPADRR